MDEARAWACGYLGRPVTGDEWTRASEIARRKLDRLIEREGDAEGERLKPYYFGKLAQEAILQFCWDDEFDELVRRHKEERLKRESEHKKCGGRSQGETTTTTHTRIILHRHPRRQGARRRIVCG